MSLIHAQAKEVVENLIRACVALEARGEFGPWDLRVGEAWRSRLRETYALESTLGFRLTRVHGVRGIIVSSAVAHDAFEIIPAIAANASLLERV